MVEDIDTNLTIGSIGGARSVCDTLSSNRDLSQDQRAALMYAEAILYSIEEDLEEQAEDRWSDDDDSGPHVIPIPPEAMSEEAMHTVVEWAMGRAKDNRES